MPNIKTGAISIIKPGITTVTASQDDGPCVSGSGNMTLTINKKDINIDPKIITRPRPNQSFFNKLLMKQLNS